MVNISRISAKWSVLLSLNLISITNQKQSNEEGLTIYDDVWW